MRRIRLLLAGVLAAAVVPVALAIAQSAPVVTSAAATAVSDTGATLNGSVNPGSVATDYAFQWGPTTGYGEETTLTSAGSGSTASSVSAALTGLDPGTTYHFRTIAINAGGTSVGADETFTTTGTAPSPSTPPAVVTGTASGVGQAGATVGGTVDADGQTTSYYWEYGTTTDYGFETTPVSVAAGSYSVAPVTTALSGLAANTTYHYRLVAVNAGGVSLGSDATFTTTNPPVVTTAAATSVGADGATFNGTVNPEGHSSTYYFQYGTTTSYGLQTAPASAGSGTSIVSVDANVTGLMPSTSYHYRLVSTSSQGTSYGPDETTTTTGSATAASKVKVMGHEGFVSPGGVVGINMLCYDGAAKCSGELKLTVDGNTIGSRGFSIGANSGGAQDMGVNAKGKTLLKANKVNHLLNVDYTITTTAGQKYTGTVALAEWLWTSNL